MSPTVQSKNAAENINLFAESSIFNTEPEPAFDDITQLAATLCQTPYAFVMLASSDQRYVKSEFGFEAAKIAPRAGAFCDQTILGKEFLEVPDTLADDRFCRHPLVTDSPSLRFYAGVPLITSQDFVLGTLCVLDTNPRKLNATQIQQLKILGRQVITHLELRKNVRQLEILNQSQEESSAFHKALLNSMSIAIVAVDNEMTFTFYNKGAEKLWGYSAQDMLGANATNFKFFNPAYIEERKKLVRQKYQLPDDAEVKPFTTETNREGILEAETPIMCSDGTMMLIDLTFTQIIKSTGEPLGYLGVAKDISQRKKNEEQLKQSLAEISDLYNNAPCGYASLNQDGIFIRANNTFLTWLGYTRVELIGKMGAADLFPKEALVRFQQRFAELKRQGVMNAEIELIKRDGTILPLLLNATAEYDENGNFIQTRSVLVDTSERRIAEKLKEELYTTIEKTNAQLEVVVQRRTAELRETIGSLVVQIQERERAEQLMRQLSHRLVTIQEEERHHIARELHDEIGQYLTALKLQLEMILHAVSQAHSNLFDEAQKLVNELIGKTRQISLNLRPTLLDDLGLLPALEAYIRRYQTNTSIKINLVHTSIPGQRFSARLELTAFRIIQEALTNIARYANVTSADLRLWVDKNILCIEIQDEGVGFDYQAALTTGNSSGLLSMRERATLVGGNLRIHSEPKEGTLISVTLPLSEQPI